jgi:hypothetical protein
VFLPWDKRDQVSNLYRTSGKIIILFTLIKAKVKFSLCLIKYHAMKLYIA